MIRANLAFEKNPSQFRLHMYNAMMNKGIYDMPYDVKATMAQYLVEEMTTLLSTMDKPDRQELFDSIRQRLEIPN